MGGLWFWPAFSVSFVTTEPSAEIAEISMAEKGFSSNFFQNFH
jgi:hypothetical protein